MLNSKLFQDLAECLGWKANSFSEYQLGAYEDVLQFLGFLNIDVSAEIVNLEISTQKDIKDWQFNAVTLSEKLDLAKQLDLMIPDFGAELQLSEDLLNFNAIYLKFKKNSCVGQ